MWIEAGENKSFHDQKINNKPLYPSIVFALFCLLDIQCNARSSIAHSIQFREFDYLNYLEISSRIENKPQKKIVSLLKTIVKRIECFKVFRFDPIDYIALKTTISDFF